MPKRIRFIELYLENFTVHRGSRTIRFGSITRLTGKNGQGKTSIGTAPVWVLFGTDLFGRKWSPKPVNYDADVTRATLMIDVDGNLYKFERSIEGDKFVYRLNDVPVKATEFDAAVASFFDKDEFMSLYFPAYFFNLHWTKQREIILRYTVPPVKSEVLKHLSGPQAEKLAELTQKHSLDELEKIYRDKANRLDKDYIAAKSRTSTLQEQLLVMDSVQSVDPATAQQDTTKIDATIAEIEQAIAGADENNRRIFKLQDRIKTLLEKRDELKEKFKAVQAEPIEEVCRVCKQPLKGESVEAAKADKERRLAEIKAEFDQVVADRKAAEAELAGLELIDVSEKLAELIRWREARQAIIDAQRAAERRKQLEQDIEKARKDEADTLAALNEAKFIVDAIKAYRAKEAEMQAEKVQSLFNRLQIRLFRYVKSTSEYEPDFSIQMDGKDYAILSTGEKIAAGLELTEILFKKSELIVPVFIDGIGEYTGPIAVYDQLITAGAVRDQELRIETEEWAS